MRLVRKAKECECPSWKQQERQKERKKSRSRIAGLLRDSRGHSVWDQQVEMAGSRHLAAPEGGLTPQLERLNCVPASA